MANIIIIFHVNSYVIPHKAQNLYFRVYLSFRQTNQNVY